MLAALTTLLVFQLIGESISYGSGAPIPGPVIGMALLFFYLQARPSAAARLKDTALSLLTHLSLLFVPAGVGILLFVDRVRDEWLAILVALIVSTALSITVTALTIRATSAFLERRSERRSSSGST